MHETTPSLQDWDEKNMDADCKYAFNKFFGVSNKEADVLFKKSPLAALEDIRSMPPKPFCYYLLAFRDYLLSGDHGFLNGSDAASGYLNTIKEALENSPLVISEIMPELKASIVFLSNNQSYFDADPDIYGDFSIRAADIMQLYEKVILGHDYKSMGSQSLGSE
ncbi:hypothetical protein [Chitinivorax sp. B]|uniref:hypothetical protein n=1 Tax=Chitinivorax sp. B TaxID=2502235 RepID=UPI0010F85800|nr:hypothetical protein [Chitinivorax sp. B]